MKARRKSHGDTGRRATTGIGPFGRWPARPHRPSRPAAPLPHNRGVLSRGIRDDGCTHQTRAPTARPRRSEPTGAATPASRRVTTEALTLALERALDERRRAECMAHIQSDAVQLALDVLVTGEDIDGYFKAFIKSLVDNCESHACGVWLRDDEGDVLRHVDGLHRRPVLHAGDGRLGGAGDAARGDGRAPARLCARLDRDCRIHRRRRAAARGGASTTTPRRRSRRCWWRR